MRQIAFDFVRCGAVPARGGAAVMLLALLAACADANMGSLLTPTATSAAPTQVAAATTAPAPSAAGRDAVASQSVAQSLTPEQINAECWMSVESNKKVRDIDQRLKLVDKCVQERTRAK